MDFALQVCLVSRHVSRFLWLMTSLGYMSSVALASHCELAASVCYACLLLSRISLPSPFPRFYLSPRLFFQIVLNPYPCLYVLLCNTR
ncbi:uncharacterized protein EI90DRAFT_3280199, partial [Cantharellus anzutake]|uniref:uncharacterized protein n=1 Tax=Cantharellus anzutake TaxID=1750568 RepID=UPI0019059CB7